SGRLSSPLDISVDEHRLYRQSAARDHGLSADRCRQLYDVREESGFGREKGEAALDEYLVSKNVMIDFSGDDSDPFAVKV
ncbi:MAG: hypothetical protein AB7S98_15265, partial [Burkholderiaceae bacterium]